MSTSRLFHCFIWKMIVKNEISKLFCPWRSNRNWKDWHSDSLKSWKEVEIVPLSCHKSNLCEKEFVWSKKKEKIENSTFRQLLKVEKRHFKSLFNVLFVRFMKICFIHSFCVSCVSKCKRCIFFFVGTNSFQIKVRNSDLKISLPRYLILKESSDCVFQRNESIQFENFRQVCFHKWSKFLF